MSYEYNKIGVNTGDFRANLYGLRFNYSFTPKMFFNSFIQYNTETNRFLTNIRFNLEHRPLSYISFVLTEDRLRGLSGVEGSDDVVGRALILKYTHLFQF